MCYIFNHTHMHIINFSPSPFTHIHAFAHTLTGSAQPNPLRNDPLTCNDPKERGLLGLLT